MIGCDIVVTVGDESLAKMQLGRTRAVVNSDASVTSEFVRTVAEQARTGDLARFRDPEFPTQRHGGPDRRRGRRQDAAGSWTPAISPPR